MEQEQAILSSFMSVSQGTKIQVEYVWIGGNGGDLRSKTVTKELEEIQGKQGKQGKEENQVKELPKEGPKPILSPTDLEDWSYDGSSTNQAHGKNSEVILKPRAVFKDPFRGHPNVLVLCDTYPRTPLPSNTRHAADEAMTKVKDQEPWFGLEQEYTLFNTDKTPLGWPKGGFPGSQGPYYCGVGADCAFGRSIVEAHYKACMHAGIKIGGVNAEVMASQWEFQIGPSTGIDAADHLWMARYILHRVCERFGVVASFHPKPMLEGDWNGAGCHTNFSTKATRADGGYKVIEQHIEKLKAKHKEHIQVYGEHNNLRLTGRNETAPITAFSHGVADRKASVRIPTAVHKAGKGYYEDRRPAANMDPYLVTNRIVVTTLLE